jgi:4-hydroxy-tetrahydrodipicolinate reductase
MDAVIFGNGPMGRAIAAAVEEQGGNARVVGRPSALGHDPHSIGGADVVFDASRGDAVAANVNAALAAGCQRFVLATTAWDAERVTVDARLRAGGAAAVAASNLSIGVALFGRLVDEAVRLYGPVEAFDPYVVEWHRRTKRDRPSGTAKELSRRIIAAHGRKRRVADPGLSGPPEPGDLDVTVIRAGASPGMHLVGFDAPGESVELRITARDRSAYAAGALAAADWLLAAPRSPGIHGFDAVVDDLLAISAMAPVTALTA